MRIVQPNYEPWQRDIVAIAEDIINLIHGGDSLENVRHYAVDAVLVWEEQYR